MTTAESIAIKWLQTTMMSNSAYSYYAHYFSDLLNDGWTEKDLIELPQGIFSYYEAAQNLMRCTISEFAKAVKNDMERQK